MEKEKKLLFSLTAKDFEVQTFRAGGKGGQHQNKTESGVRIIHHASGARGEARDSRDQHQNKKNAFMRLVATPEFKKWHKFESAKRLGQIDNVEKIIEREMKNIKVETLDENEKWILLEEEKIK
jgi:protein subunit release factor A